MTLLIADRLCRSFGRVVAVQHVTFELAAGEMLALVGPNGAGKTTLLDLVGGQLRADRGRLRLSDDDVSRAGPRAIARLGVGRTFQAAAYFASMTVRENIQTAILAARDEIGAWWRPARGRHRSRADLLLDRVGLLEHAERGAAWLTTPERRRLDLALALAHRPRLLLLDELTVGLLPADKADLMGLVQSLARREDVAVLFSEHDMRIVLDYADRVLVLDHGTLIADCDPACLRTEPHLRTLCLDEAETHRVEPARTS